MTRISATSLLGLISTISYSDAFSLTSTSSNCPGTTSSTTTTATTTTKWGHARQHQQQQRQQRSSVRLQSIFYDDFEDFSDFSPQDSNSNSNSNSDSIDNKNNNSNGNGDTASSSSFSDGDLFASLRARQDSLKNEQQEIQLQAKESQQGDLIERQLLNYNWNEANCLSTVRLTIDDWIRRMAVDLYPLVVCGSSRGNLYLGDLEDGDEMDCLERVHSDEVHPDIPDDIAEACLQALYDGYDGNGPFAIAIKKDLIVSSGREGGIHACTIVGKDEEVASGSRGGTARQTKLKLQREGTFRGLEGGISSSSGSDDLDAYDGDGSSSSSDTSPPLITTLAFDDRGTLWAGGYDGILRGYNHEELDADDRPLMLRQKRPDFDIDVGAPILEVNVVDETGVIVVTTHTDGVLVYSLDDGRFLLHVNPFASRNLNRSSTEKQKQFTRTAMIVRNDNSTTTATIESNDDDDSGTSRATLIVGGSFGHLYQFPLRIVTDDANPSRTVEVITETTQKIRPKHMGPIVSLASPSPGLFVTASHDGTMRVWDCSLADGEEEEDEDDDDDDDDDEEEEDNNVPEENKGSTASSLSETRPKMPKVLYALSGYKVWLGSVFANDRKLVSDGADNTVIVHSFDEDEDAILRSQQEDDEDNDLGDDPFSSLS